MKKAFTLVEILVSLVIFAILFVLLMQVYIKGSDVYIHQNFQKIIEKEILSVNQNIQNLADEYLVDYSEYDNLEDVHGLVDTLYLQKKLNGAVVEKLKLSIVWNCEDEDGCYLELDKNGIKIPLTNKKLVKIPEFKIKLNPYKDPYSLSFEEDKRRQPYITLFMDIRIKSYNEDLWTKKIDYHIQEWFNFKYYGK